MKKRTKKKVENRYLGSDCPICKSTLVHYFERHSELHYDSYHYCRNDNYIVGRNNEIIIGDFDINFVPKGNIRRLTRVVNELKLDRVM